MRCTLRRWLAESLVVGAAMAAPASLLGAGAASAQDDAPAMEAPAGEPAAGEPAAGEPAGEDAAPPPAPKQPERPANAPMSDQTLDARLQALEDLVRRYEEQTEDFREEVRSIAERKYKERRRQIEESYAKQLAPVIEAERRYRVDAIAAFERFLERHPDDPVYTPDALFRLAELYFEKYDDEHQQNMKQYRADYEAWLAAGGEGEPPGEPEQHFERTIALYQRLITDFPSYRLLDGAYYLLGYTLRAQGETEEGMKAWQTLVARYPNSRFYGEVWFRIGDHHFDEEQWPDAIAAFKKVVPLTDSTYYDKGLYKLAWTYYLVNEFELSTTRFFELLDFSYKKREEGELEGGSVLEEEAITYVAISFTDDNWKRPNQYKRLIAGDSFEDEFAEVEIDYVSFAIDYFNEVEKKGGAKKPYRREIFAKLGDILFKQSKNRQAVLALSHAIELDPLHRNAPELQDLVVQAWEREREFDKASQARDALVKNYGENSDWAKKHMNDSEATKKAKELARISLYKAAIYYHQQAQKLFEDDKQDLGVQFFKAAAQAYEEYLTNYPHDKEAYELSYYLADTYYYSLQFDRAAEQYAKVRDSTQGKKYRDEAAINVMYSLEKVIEAEVASGKLEDVDIFAKRPVPEGTDPATLQPKEVPDLRKRYMSAVDDVLTRAPNHEKAPIFAYKVAALANYYQHFDDANRRFEEIINKYPGTEAAKFSANFILDYYLVRQDWVNAAKYAQQFKGAIQGDSEFLALADKVIGGSRFQLAKKKLEDGDKALGEGRITDGIAMLEEGADEYLKLLEEDPKREFADVMMYNAALSLEKARRPARAAELYERLYKEYPESPQAPEAMFRVASKSEQAFNFNKAVDTYLALVDKYPESERRADAQINAALALEGQQRYDEAAKQFERFATLFPDRPEAPEVFFRASIVQRKTKNTNNEIASLKRFMAKYKGKPEQLPRVIEANVRIGDIYNERAQAAKSAKDRRDLKKSAVASWEKAVDDQKRAKGSAAATYYAAKAAFFLAEEQWDDYNTMPIKSTKAKKQAEELVDKTKRLTEVEKTYKDVITEYKQAEWSLASLYRVGALYDQLQRAIFEAPCPKEIERIDPIACDEYIAALEDKAYAVEEKAVEAYRVAYERAKELKLKNEWTKRTLEALNLLRPAEFRIDKEPLTRAGRGDVYSLGLVFPNGGAGELQKVAPGEAVGQTPPPSEGGGSAGGGTASTSGGGPEGDK